MTTFKQVIGAVGTSMRESLNALLTLVKMQLKEKMDLSYLRSTRRLIFKIVWLLIEFAAITACITIVFNYVKTLRLLSLMPIIPVSLISVVFLLMMGLSIVTDTVGLMKALYFSKDNTVLLTFPATPSLIFFSKLATYYVYELRKSFMFTIPMFIAFGITSGYKWFFYPWLIAMFVLISIIPVLISAILSIPSMFLYVFLNRVKVLQYILYASLAVGGVLLLWTVVGMIPTNIDLARSGASIGYKIRVFLNDFKENVSFFYILTKLIVGEEAGLTSHGIASKLIHAKTLPTLLILIGIGAVTLVICFLISKPLFCKMASTPFEFKKKNAIKEKKNKTHGAFLSSVKKEWLGGLRSNSFIKLFGILVVIMPMAIELLNKFYSAMDMSYLGIQMTVCFNVFIILIISMMTNIDIASVYSRDGSSAYLNKVQPAPYAKLLFSKLIFNMIISLIGISFTTFILSDFYLGTKFGNPMLTAKDMLMIGVTMYMMYLAHLFSSAESDIMNPQYDQYATFSDQANNPNESRSAISAILMSALIFVAGFIFSSENLSGAWTKLGFVAAAIAAFKAVTFFSKIKVFYKEKQ